jgi:S-adenosylmethionine hydrolase
VLVGPDNGLLLPAIEAAGGADCAWEISRSPARLEGTRRTFHGRDVFSPVAARLARGEDASRLGSEIEARSLVSLELPRARIADGRIEATVLAGDRYGNLVLNLVADQVEDSFLRPGARILVSTGGGAEVTVPYVAAFGEVDEGAALIYPDSSGSLALAVNRGDASAEFGIGPDDTIRLTPSG